MTNEDRFRKDLREILDRLAPGLVLRVDDRYPSLLGSVPEAAKEFARANDCSFIPDKAGGGDFIRAYPKGIGPN
ncbi:MAG TPA: hypothetical protein VEI03_03090 [Stellaceae bacterium]|nr:hypothetical protein [Stellaceae bacterium]